MTRKVGVIRDERYLEHKPGLVHPEAPGRLRSVYRMLDKEFENRLVQIEPKLATLEQLQMAHTPTYIDLIMMGILVPSPTNSTVCIGTDKLACWMAFVRTCMKR